MFAAQRTAKRGIYAIVHLYVCHCLSLSSHLLPTTGLVVGYVRTVG